MGRKLEKVDEFINWSASNTRAIEGMGMYARLYFGVYDNLRSNEKLFSDTHADWTKLRTGLRDLIRLYPRSKFHKNIFALMACEANDKQAYNEVRNLINETEKWSWSSKYTVRVCDEKFGYSKQRIANADWKI